MILYACVIGMVFLCSLGLIYGRSCLFNAGLYCGVATLIMMFVVCATYLNTPSVVQEVEQEYYSLMYQLENSNSEDELLMSKIERYNYRIESRREIQRDPIIGVFVSDIWDGFELIEVRTAEPSFSQ